MSSTLVTLALFVVGANARMYSCSVVTTGANVSELSSFVRGSNADVTYGFSGEPALNNGLMCTGCAKKYSGESLSFANTGRTGTWYTGSDVNQGESWSQPSQGHDRNGFLCPSDGSACSSYTGTGGTIQDVFSASGRFYSSEAIRTDVTTTSTGVLCPEGMTGDQETCSNTCAAVKAWDRTTCLGTFCLGTTGVCTASNNRHVTQSDGVHCSGCAYKKSGETAEVAGIFWVASDVASNVTATQDGIFCPADGSSYPGTYNNGDTYSRNGCSSMTTARRRRGRDPPDVSTAAGQFFSSSTVAAGATVSQDGALCPVIPSSTGNSASSVALPLFTILVSFFVHYKLV